VTDGIESCAESRPGHKVAAAEKLEIHMRQVALQMGMSLDGYVASDRQHPALAAHGLIDEYCLVIQPVAVGRGQALFAELPEALRLELIEARSFECGVVVHVYRPPSG
jgi:hypothetical protein